MLSLYLHMVSPLVIPVSDRAGMSGEGTHSINSIVLMIKPRVGLTEVTSSFIIRFTIVVFPALSNPLEPS